MSFQTYHSFAKINLGLQVFPRRESDGYHPILSVFQTISIFDVITFRCLPEVGRFEWACDHPDLLCGEDNLLFRVFQRMQVYCSFGVSISLSKAIPLGSGLGGASSNAAAFLLWIETVMGVSRIDTLYEAVLLGSDIPFFLTGGCAKVSGVGEYVVRSDQPTYEAYVLINPGFGVSTQAAYGWFDEDYGSNGVFGAYRSRFQNDLQAPVFSRVPLLKTWFEKLEALGLSDMAMSGSGATLFCPFETRLEAESMAALICSNYTDIWVRVVIPTTTGVRQIA